MYNLSKELREELEQNILPFWMNRMIDQRNGGFLGRIDGCGNPVPDAEKGAILNARILWAFAAAYRVLHKPEYLETATRAKDYFINHFNFKSIVKSILLCTLSKLSYRTFQKVL